MYLALRNGDGRQANIPYVWQPLGPGVYQPTPPGSPPYTPVAPWQAQLLPFSFDSSSQYRAPAPPLLTSAEYTTDFNEVKMYGSSGHYLYYSRTKRNCTLSYRKSWNSRTTKYQILCSISEFIFS